MSFDRPSNVERAHIQQVIVVDSVVGLGTEGNPARIIREFYSLEGQFLARRDPYLESLVPGNQPPGAGDA